MNIMAQRFPHNFLFGHSQSIIFFGHACTTASETITDWPTFSTLVIKIGHFGNNKTGGTQGRLSQRAHWAQAQGPRPPGAPA
jgi:hypothetical protein